MASGIALRKLTRASASLHCHAAIRRMPLDFEWLGEPWEATVSPVFAPRHGLECVAADWGGSTLLVQMDRATIARVGLHVLGADIDHLLDADLRALVIEAAFSELADAIESNTRKRFKLLDEKVPDDGQRHWFRVRLDDGRQTVEADVGLDHRGLGFFAETVRRLPVDPGVVSDWGGLPVPVRFMVGLTDLPIDVFEGLKRRDVILLDESWIGPDADAIVANFGQRYAAAAAINGRTITLTEELEVMMDLDIEHDPSEGEGLGKLSVRLSFDLGERPIALAELMHLGPGHVFDLGRDVRKAVTIRANGRTIGEGEIVDVDGQIGVVVLRLEATA